MTPAEKLLALIAPDAVALVHGSGFQVRLFDAVNRFRSGNAEARMTAVVEINSAIADLLSTALDPLAAALKVCVERMKDESRCSCDHCHIQREGDRLALSEAARLASEGE